MSFTEPQIPEPSPTSDRVVVIEDDALLSDLLAHALRTRLQLANVQVYSRGRSGLEHCLRNPPDLLMVDLRLPDMNGREIVQTLRARWPALRVVVLTGETNPALPAELLTLGVSGFVHKTSPLAEIEMAVQRVLAGGFYFSAAFTPVPVRSTPDENTARNPLTEREREIARLVASGLISKEIAARLHLSPRTVEKARAQILGKLGLRDLPSLVRWCMQQGLV